MLIFLMTMITAGVVSVFADPSCDQAIDLRKSGGSMRGIDPTAQGYSDLCGFYTFSNYLDSYRVSRNGEDGSKMIRSNPVSIGVENAVRKNLPYWFPIQNSTDPLSLTQGRAGATFCALAKSVKEIGYCLDSEVPSRTVEATEKFANLTTYFYRVLLEIAEASSSHRKMKIDAKMSELYAKYFSWASGGKQSILGRDALRAIIEGDPKKPYALIQKIFFPKCGESVHREFDFRFETCHGELYFEKDSLGIPTSEKDSKRMARASKKISELLERPHTLPIPIAYCSVVLKEGKIYGDRLRPFDLDCGLHWSVIVGRRKIDNECYLLVHNSWGNKAKYSTDWKLDREDIWVRERELTRSMVLAQWLD